MSTPDPAARRPRLGRRTAVLAGTAASALLAGATRTTWVQASAPDLTGTAQSVDVLGADAAPAVLALALAGIAASLATSLSSAWVRFLTGPVLLLAGAGAGIAALGVMRAPEAAAGSAVASATGVVGAQIEAETTSWPLLALVPALAVAGIGVLMLLAGGGWPRSTRYRSAAVTATADPSDDPAAAWDALTRGEDPSLGDPGDAHLGDRAEPRLGDPEEPAAARPEDEAPPAAR